MRSALSVLRRRPLPRPSHLAPPCPGTSTGAGQAGRERARGRRRAGPPRLPDFQVLGGGGSWARPEPRPGGSTGLQGPESLRCQALATRYARTSSGHLSLVFPSGPRRTRGALRWPMAPTPKRLLWLTAGLSPEDEGGRPGRPGAGGRNGPGCLFTGQDVARVSRPQGPAALCLPRSPGRTPGGG